MCSILGVQRGNSAVDSTVGQVLELVDKDFKVVLITTLTMSRKLSNLSKKPTTTRKTLRKIKNRNSRTEII